MKGVSQQVDRSTKSVRTTRNKGKGQVSATTRLVDRTSPAYSPATNPDLAWTRLVNRHFRPPDWRSQLATKFVSHPAPPTTRWMIRWVDPVVRELVTLERQSLSPDHPFAKARTLHQTGRTLLRIEVEARLLAGQLPSTIDKTTGLRNGTTQWYHDAYFDCTDRLHAKSVIRHSFLAESPEGNRHGIPSREWLRWYGYYHGLPAIELLLETFRHWESDRRPVRGKTAKELSCQALRLRVQANLLSRSMSTETMNRSQLRALFALAANFK